METETIIPLFEPNQILSSTHLNQLREYLDNETRYSRIKLSGVGIACGLNLKSFSSSQIVVTTGYGITTDGFLLDLVRENGAATITYTRYQPYIDPMFPAYNFGKSPATDSTWHESSDTHTDEKSSAKKKKTKEDGGSSSKPPKDLTVLPEIFELFTNTVTDYDKEAKQLTAFDTDTQAKKKLEDMALVYLCEFEDANLKSCTGTNCDNKGKRRDVTLRMLLVPVARLSEYKVEDFLKKNDVLDFLDIPRLTRDQLKTIVDQATLKNAYQSTIIDAHAGVLKSAIENAFGTYGYLLALTKKDYAKAIGRLDKAVNAEYIGANATYIQYAAGLLNDVTQAYNEFAQEAWLFLRSCGKIPDSFPRHLTIGQLKPGTSDAYDQRRTVFFNVPPVDAQDMHLHNARMLFGKMLKMLICYQDASKRPIDKGNIRLTPDGTAQQTFSERSIPYYYASGEAADLASLRDLVDSWNPYRTLRGEENQRYGYFAKKYAAPKPYSDPLDYSLMQAPMLRIEGIAGVNVEEAKNKLDEIKLKYNLDFDVQLLRLESDAPDFNGEYQCGLDDLQSDYLLVREEIVCCLKTLYSTIRDNGFAPVQYEKKSEGYLAEGKMYAGKFPLAGNRFLADAIRENAYLASAMAGIQASHISISDVNNLLDEVFKNLPSGIKDFDYGSFLIAFKKLQHWTIQYRALLESLIKIVEEALRNFEINYQSWNDEYEMHRLIDRLRYLNCNCVYPKLGIVEALRDQRLENRKQASLFVNFFKANPGPEHFAGVPQRGTFYMVYSKTKLYNSGPEYQVVADFASGGICCGTSCYQTEEDIHQPLVAVYDEKTISGLKLEKAGKIEIDILKNDYYLSDPDKAVRDVSISVEETPETKNAGSISIDKSGDYPVVVYSGDGKTQTSDCFLLKITDNKTGLYDFSTLVVHVTLPGVFIINTKPDKACTLAEHKVRINVMVNDNNQSAPGNPVKIILIGPDGQEYQPGTECPTEKGNTAVGETENGVTTVVFNAANTKQDSIKDTLTDSFMYKLEDSRGNVSLPTLVEVDILPCCDTKLKFALPRRTFCKNDVPVPFEIDVPGGLTDTLAVKGPGVSNTKPGDTKNGTWMFDPGDSEVNTTDVTFTLLYRDTKQILGTIAAKVHPIASFEGQAIRYSYGQGQVIYVYCTSELQEAAYVEWFVNGDLVSSTPDYLSHAIQNVSLGQVVVMLKAYHEVPTVNPNCYHEVTREIIVENYNPAKTYGGEATLGRYTNKIEIASGDTFNTAVAANDVTLGNDTVRLSHEVSKVLLDKTELAKLKTAGKETLLKDASDMLNRLGTAAGNVTDPSPEPVNAVYDVYKSNTIDTLALVVASTGTSKPTEATSAVLADVGAHLTELKKAGQLGAQDIAEIDQLIVSAKSNTQLSKMLNEIKLKL